MATTFDYSKVPVNSGLTRGDSVPSNIINEDLLSPDSIASNCFINQSLSRKLQIYLVGYVNSIYSNYSVYK